MVMDSRIISSVELQNFRSIRKSGPIVLGSSNAIFGLNSCGKSNVLRALNWFFNDSVDGQPISLATDTTYSKKRPRKEIKVTVCFNPKVLKSLPTSLKKKWNPSTEFSISKAIAYKNGLPDIRIEVDPIHNSEHPDDQSGWAKSFISLLTYRYIPAYRTPSKLLKEIMAEAQRILEPSIKQSLTAGKTGTTVNLLRQDTDVFNRMQKSVQEAAGRVFSELEAKIKNTLSNIESLRAGLPKNWLSWIQELGFRFTTLSGGIVDEEAQGAGAQSYLFFVLLCFVARKTRAYGFGWRQGEIWGIEEPEIYLHQDLAVQCSRLFTDISTVRGPYDAPVQILLTTHSPQFISSMSVKLPVTIGQDGYTTFPPQVDLNTWPVLQGIVPYTHPLFTDLGKRLIIVEGKDDKRVFSKFLNDTRRQNIYKLVCVSDLTHGAAGDNSDNQMIEYIKKNAAPLAIRAASGGLIALFDVNVKPPQVISGRTRVQEAISAFRIQGNVLAKIVCLREYSPNPQLDESFSGIERFLPAKTVIEFCRIKGIDLAVTKASTYTLPPKEIQKFMAQKSHLINSFCAGPYSDEDWKYIKQVFESLESPETDAVRKSLGVESREPSSSKLTTEVLPNPTRAH